MINRCPFNTMFLDIQDGGGNKVIYRISYRNRNDYTNVEYVVHRMGYRDGDKYYWAKNRGKGAYTTNIMFDTLGCESIRNQIDPLNFRFGKFIMGVVNRLESLNSSIEND